MPRGVSPLDEARLQGRLWTPRLWLPNTAFYIRARDARGFGSGLIVPDLSGNGNHATPYQGSASAAPAYDPVRRGLVFDGKGTILTSPLSFAAFPSKSLSMIAVCSLAKQSPYRGLAIFRDSANTGAVAINIGSEGDRYTYTYGGTYNAPGPYLDNGVMDVVAASFGTFGGKFTEQMLINSTTYSDNASLSGGTGTSATLMIGSDPYDTSRVLVGTIYEIFISSAPLSLYQLRIFAAYALWEYGNPQRLASGELFRNRPPLIGD